MPAILCLEKTAEIFELIINYSCILNKISDFFEKNFNPIILVDLYVSYHNLFFATWIQINVS